MGPKPIRCLRIARRSPSIAVGLLLLVGLGRSALGETNTVESGQLPIPPAPTASVAPLNPASADPAAAPVASAKVRPSRWYGYELMISDVTALGLAAALSKTSGGTAALIGVVGFVGFPPLIHSLNGKTAMAVYSPIYRVLLPVFGALIGSGLESCSQEEWFCGLGGAIVGGGIGMAGAMIIDYSLAWQRPTSVEQSAPAPSAAGRTSLVNLAVAGVAPTSNGATFMLGGSF